MAYSKKSKARPVSQNLEKRDEMLAHNKARAIVKKRISDIDNIIPKFHTHKVALVKDKESCNANNIVKININNGQLGNIDSNIGNNCRYLSIINRQQSNPRTVQNSISITTKNGTTIEAIESDGKAQLVKNEKDFWFIKPETFLRNKIKK